MERLYCTIFIVDVSQNPEEVETITSRIQQLIEDHGGVMKRYNPWGKRRLAYPIQNKTNGYYIEIEFTANSRLDIPKIIEKEYRLNDRVLRYLTYAVTKKEQQQREFNARRKKEEIPAEETGATGKTKKASEPAADSKTAVKAAPVVSEESNTESETETVISEEIAEDKEPPTPDQR